MIRQIVFRLHLTAACVVGVVVFMLAATGVILSLEGIVTGAAERRLRVTPAEGSARLAPGAIVEVAEAWGAGQGAPFTATSLRYRPHPLAPVRVDAGRERHVYVDPYRGEVLGSRLGRVEGFFAAVNAWHRWFNVPSRSIRRGRAVTGAVNLAFLFLLVTGPFLWFPNRFTKRTLANILLIQRRAKGAWRDLNWHQVVGIWAALPLIVIAVTAVLTSYPGVADRVYPVAGRAIPAGGWPGGGVGSVVDGVSGGVDSVPDRGRGQGGRGDGRDEVAGGEAGAGGADLAAVLRTAEGWVGGWRGLTVTLPRARDSDVRVEIRGGRSGQPQKTGTLTVDVATGTPRSWESFADETPTHRAQEFFRYAHTGEYWGIPGRVVAGICSLAAALMVWTGMSLALRRLRRLLLLKRTRHG